MSVMYRNRSSNSLQNIAFCQNIKILVIRGLNAGKVEEKKIKEQKMEKEREGNELKEKAEEHCGKARKQARNDLLLT